MRPSAADCDNRPKSRPGQSAFGAVGVAVGLTVASIAVAGAASAEPPGQAKDPEAWVCDGEDVLIVTAGRNGWIDDARYQAVTFSIERTFTPTGGTPQPVTDSKTWAGGKDVNSPDLVTCTQDISETDETGTFEAHLEITAVPVG